MARFARAVALGAAHHITQRGVDQQRVFFTDADRHTYLDYLQTYFAQAWLRILAYCLTSNHIHLVAIPDEPQSLATALRRTHGRYALYINSRRHRVGHLWQNRFYSCPLDETHLSAALRYGERNPVRAELATRPEEYAWSSASAYVGIEAPSALLDWPFYTNSGGRERWIALLAEPEELAAIRALERGTFTERPLGSPDCVARLEHELGRPLAPRQGQRSRSESVLAISQ
jgi:putative transposase